MRNLKILKVEVLTWNKQVFGNLDDKYKELEIRLNKLDERESWGSWYVDLSHERRIVKCEMEELIFRRLQMDCQKAKVKWLREGDHNSKIFHSLLNQRRSRSVINKLELELELEDGSLVSDEGQIEEEIIGYFSELYRKSEGYWEIEEDID